MAADRPLALHAMLPDRYARFEVLASTIDHGGRLVALVADPAQGFTPVADWPERRPPARYDATAVVCDRGDVQEIALAGLDRWFTHIDSLGNGIVLVCARSDPPAVPDALWLDAVPTHELHRTPNLHVFDSNGRARTSVYVGDGIEQLVTDTQGRIWTSYFDESSYWYANPDGTRSRTFMVGLARWDDTSGQPWLVPSDTPTLAWVDCYALNVGRYRVHACPYPDFPLVELGPDRVRAVIANTVTRCTGLAVAGTEFAFLDQHRADDDSYRWEIRRASLDANTVVEQRREHLVLPDGRQPSGWARGKIGRDETLFLRMHGDPRRWYRYDIDT